MISPPAQQGSAPSRGRLGGGERRSLESAEPPPHGEGSKSFSSATARLAGLAARALGWPPGEFWAATPAELALSLGADEPGEAPPTRADLMTMIERETDARSD